MSLLKKTNQARWILWNHSLTKLGPDFGEHRPQKTSRVIMSWKKKSKKATSIHTDLVWNPWKLQWKTWKSAHSTCSRLFERGLTSLLQRILQEIRKMKNQRCHREGLTWQPSVKGASSKILQKLYSKTGELVSHWCSQRNLVSSVRLRTIQVLHRLNKVSSRRVYNNIKMSYSF